MRCLRMVVVKMEFPYGQVPLERLQVGARWSRWRQAIAAGCLVPSEGCHRRDGLSSTASQTSLALESLPNAIHGFVLSSFLLYKLRAGQHYPTVLGQLILAKKKDFQGIELQNLLLGGGYILFCHYCILFFPNTTALIPCYCYCHVVGHVLSLLYDCYIVSLFCFQGF